MPKLYGSTNQATITGVTGEIESGGAGNVTAFDADVFWANHATFNSLNVSQLNVQLESSHNWRLILEFSDYPTPQTLASGGPSIVLDYGITLAHTFTIGTDKIDLTTITTTTDVTKEITKLYGSVNGQTKLIRKLYGSVNGQTKLIYQA